MKRLIAFCVHKSLAVNLISALAVAGGLYAAWAIQREAFPSVNFDLVVISASYPGATPREVESLIIAPIEDELSGIDGIETIRSSAFSGFAQISIEIDPNYDDRSRLVSEVQRAVDRANLPDDMPADPVITEIKSEQAPILSFSVFGPLSELELKRIADRIEDDLLNIPGVARVLAQGKRKEEIRIVVDPEKLAAERISLAEIARAVRGWNITAPGGQIELDGRQYAIRVVGEFRDPKDAAGLVLRANDEGGVVRLGDVAKVIETLRKPSRIVRAMGEPSINFTVLKKGDADIIRTVDRIRAYLKTIPKRYDARLKVRAYNDFSLITRLRLSVLTSNGALGLVFVLALLLLLLRPAVAVTTAWGLPVIFFSGLLVLFLAGQTLNLLTMFGFIIVLGLMVDDAIIIGENTAWHLERGMPVEEAAIHGASELAGPVIATVLTTIVAFLPLMFMKGIIGKFMFSIPLVVITLLAFSLVEALFVLPSHIRDIARAHVRTKPRRVFVWLLRAYAPALGWALRHRWVTLFLALVALLGALKLAGAMRFQLFPPGAESVFYLRVELPPGTTLEETDRVLRAIDREVRRRIPPEILETTTLVAGENSADRREALKRIGDRFGFVRVILIPFTERTISAYAVMDRIQKEVPPLFPEAKTSFAMMKPGPPVGRALQVEITGDEAAARRAAERLVKLLHTIQGVYAIESDLDPGEPELRIALDRAKAAYAGVDLATAAQHLKAAFDGWIVDTIRRADGEEADVVIRYPAAARKDVSSLLQLGIPNQQGGLVPLGRIARTITHRGEALLHRKDGRRVIYVSAEVDPKTITSRALNRLVKAKFAEWAGPDRARIQVHLGGEQERSEESVRGLIASFVFALLGIYVILAVQFESLLWPWLVMFAIPFGALGIIIGFWLHGMPLSFMALMGFVALSGIVVNNAIVIGVFMQRALREGRSWQEAAQEAGERRLRAVLLTTLTTVVGLLPTAYGWGGLDPFVAPMALALSWGLIFSTFITLFAIPALLGAAHDVRALFARAMKIRSS
ncbi:MAG: efflux RND transporter permease subunit [Zetaproteobacteria bacterium]|nr:MAG: efflux RND transporter permease subunit [Zetaproteobacteria bacterium]